MSCKSSFRIRHGAECHAYSVRHPAGDDLSDIGMTSQLYAIGRTAIHIARIMLMTCAGDVQVSCVPLRTMRSGSCDPVTSLCSHKRLNASTAYLVLLDLRTAWPRGYGLF